MGTVTVTLRDGTDRLVEMRAGASLMEVLRDADIDGILALCGGNCACATCHVYVDDGELASLSPMSADEDDLLDSSDHRQPNSRLSCQISLAPHELHVTVAPED
jgi:2Fe-2S ferredoxin